MNGFDILVLIIVGISALLAFARGFVREVLSMAALAIAILAAVWGLPVFREPVRTMVKPDWVADTATVVCIFLLIYIAVRVLTGRIHEWVHDSEPLGMIDRTAGILFGVARGFAIMAIGVLIITSVAKKEMRPKFMTEAQFYPFLFITAEALKVFTPNAAKTYGDVVKNAGDAGQTVAKWRDNAEMLNDASKIIDKSNILKSKEGDEKTPPNDEAETPNNSLKVEKK